jgi:hypothetical protein
VSVHAASTSSRNHFTFEKRRELLPLKEQGYVSTLLGEDAERFIERPNAKICDLECAGDIG